MKSLVLKILGYMIRLYQYNIVDRYWHQYQYFYTNSNKQILSNRYYKTYQWLFLLTDISD